MDIKLNEAPPREGVSLIQTALIHEEESKGRTKLKQSDGKLCRPLPPRMTTPPRPDEN